MKIAELFIIHFSSSFNNNVTTVCLQVDGPITRGF